MVLPCAGRQPAALRRIEDWEQFPDSVTLLAPRFCGPGEAAFVACTEQRVGLTRQCSNDLPTAADPLSGSGFPLNFITELTFPMLWHLL